MKRDEQRISLGMLFASLSFLCALAALYVGASTMPVRSRSEWLIIVGVLVASAGRCGCAYRPIALSMPGVPYAQHERLAYLGVVAGAISAITMIITLDSAWRFAAVLPLAGLVLWSIPVSFSRFVSHMIAPGSRRRWDSALLAGAGGGAGLGGRYLWLPYCYWPLDLLS